jgi:hypothetical protein
MFFFLPPFAPQLEELVIVPPEKAEQQGISEQNRRIARRGNLFTSRSPDRSGAL